METKYYSTGSGRKSGGRSGQKANRSTKKISQDIDLLKQNLNLIPPNVARTIKSIPTPTKLYTKNQTETEAFKKRQKLMNLKSALTQQQLMTEEGYQDWNQKTFEERIAAQGTNTLQTQLKSRQNKLKQNFLSEVASKPTDLIIQANQRDKWIRDNLSNSREEWARGSEILAKYGSNLRDIPMSELRSMWPDMIKEKEKEYKIVQQQAGFIGAVLAGFDKDLVRHFGSKKIEQMEVQGALNLNRPDTAVKFLTRALESSTLDIVPFTELQGLGQQVYYKNGKMYYRGLEVGGEYLTEAGKSADAAANMAARFAGALPTYAVGAGAIKGAVSAAANAKNFTRTAQVFSKLDKMAKTNSLWKSVLAEATVFNVMEESGEALIRKSAGQEYTFSNFLNGLMWGAGLGSTIQIGGGVIKGAQLKSQLRKADDVYAKTKDLKSIENLPLGNSTFGEYFRESRFAYLDAFRKQGRPGIERAAPLAGGGQKIYHATTASGAKGITENGFDIKLSGSKTGADFGEGVYFSTKRSAVKKYGDTIMEVELQPSAKILDLYGDKFSGDLKVRQAMAALKNGAGTNYDVIRISGGQWDGLVVVKNPSVIITQPILDKTPLKTDSAAYLGGDKQLSPSEFYGRGKSKVGLSIEKRAIKEKLGRTFEDTAEYDKINLEDQANRAAELVIKDVEYAKDIINGKQELPSNLRGVALISALEDYAVKNRDVQLLQDIANSRMTSETSVHAQEMRLMAERAPESPLAALKRIREAREKKAMRQYARSVQKEFNKLVRQVELDNKRMLAAEQREQARAVKRGAKEVGGVVKDIYKEADKELAMKAKSEQKAMAQEIKAEQRELRSELKAISKIQTADKAKRVVATEIKHYISKAVPKKEDWDSFINSITC